MAQLSQCLRYSRKQADRCIKLEPRIMRINTDFSVNHNRSAKSAVEEFCSQAPN